MKMTKKTQWIVFSVVALVLVVGGGAGVIGMLFSLSVPLTGIMALYSLIVAVGYGLLCGFGLVHGWIWLAERGWFF